jgi:hypothetical protein
MKRHYQFIWPILFLILVITLETSEAQVKVQVVSQKISKKIDWTQGMSIILNAENAEVYCTSHPANTIDLYVTIISKHEDKSIAETDLKKMKLLTEVKGSVLYLRNYIELARNESKPESAIKVIYHITIPVNCPVDIRNYFGKIEIDSLNSVLKINSQFSKIGLRKISGLTTVNTVFGDVTATRIQGETTIISDRSDITMSDFGGKLTINSSLAKINLGEMENVTNIRIEAQKSIVSLKITGFDQFAYQFDLSDCEFKKPESMVLQFTKNEIDEIIAGYNTSGKCPLIGFILNTGSLTIEQ